MSPIRIASRRRRPIETRGEIWSSQRPPLACARGSLDLSRAFTLIELLVAVLIAAAIAGATVIAISQALRARDSSEARQAAFRRAGAAADRIALDAQNLVRSDDLYDVRVLLVDAGSAGAEHDELLLFSRVSRQARAASEQNEGSSAEVQYRLQNPPSAGDPGYVLWRRQDPAPDEVPDGGGVASPIVTDIGALSIEAFDGRSWLPEWDSDRDGVPHALRITVVARERQRSGGRMAEAASRRTVALDRVPLPFATAETGSAEGGTP